MSLRQVLWMWGATDLHHGETGVQTIPRDMTYHPGLKRIVFAPVVEMLQLRTDQLDAEGNRTIGGGAPLELKVSSKCEIAISFELPATAANIEISLPHGNAIVVNYTTPSSSQSPSLSGAAGTNWTAGGAWMFNVSYKTTTSLFTDELPMLAGDSHLSIRLFIDSHIAEVYFMGGRVVLTSNIVDLDSIQTVQVSSSSDIRLSAATVYGMGDIHVGVDNVLDERRRSMPQWRD